MNTTHPTHGLLAGGVEPSQPRVSVEMTKCPGDRANGPGAWPNRNEANLWTTGTVATALLKRREHNAVIKLDPTR